MLSESTDQAPQQPQIPRLSKRDFIDEEIADLFRVAEKIFGGREGEVQELEVFDTNVIPSGSNDEVSSG